ncbi:hypothetical protein PHLCEN_2v2349 [Hermanssonia centrifuga]|uniref:TRAM domain-containing protein n=1 Tax=Hermanssonia centrifuga TaxID=98765 RepID=A0A2R6RM55_9APHY|nr:hypothetical protein PHLCEN_2v2349 [Hermanssonia centrifuga]
MDPPATSQPQVRLQMDPEEVQHIDKKPRLGFATEENDAIHEYDDHDPESSKEAMEGLTSVFDQSRVKRSRPQKKLTKKMKNMVIEPYSAQDVIFRDVISLLGQEAVDKAIQEGKDWESPFQFREEVELTASILSSTGESLAIAPAPYPPWVVLIPFALPGETVRVRIHRNCKMYSHAELLEMITPNTEMRDDSLIRCKYFGQCAGCQYQMLSYETQLDLKQEVLVKAYQNFSDLPQELIPAISPTMGSPLQYSYRTKLTPHFDRLPKAKMADTVLDGSRPDWFKIGFNGSGTRSVIDIEECPIAAPAINEGFGPLRERIYKRLYTYKQGVSLVLRESLPTGTRPRSHSPSFGLRPQIPMGRLEVAETTSDTEKKVCVTDQRATVRERVGDTIFEYPASAFFQNNNSILVPFTSYIRDMILPEGTSPQSKVTHLVDAYCGNGLFALTLASSFKRVAGIELDVSAIQWANRNAQMNKVSEDKVSFLAGHAANIFETVQDFPRDKTAVIIDPPRRGSDEKFIEQLILFGSQTVVYVSCNAHTQARDIGMIIKQSEALKRGNKYVLDSVRGFDLFPQTAHVESIAVLRLVPS